MSLPADYQKRKAQEKLDLLWAQVNADAYPESALPSRVPGPIARLKLFSVDFNRGSFELPGDELPPERPKLVHTWGSCARVTMKITKKTAYTGLFERGGEALLRFSDAKGGSSFVPSLALKFLVDGKPSLNLLTLPAAEREKGDKRCFSGAFSNATPPAKELDTKLVQRSFLKAAKALGGTRLHAIYLPLHNLASSFTDGSAPDKPMVPDRIEFHPTEEVKRACPELKDFRAALAKVPQGIKLFDLHVARDINEPTELLGELWQESGWVASKYGDERLFFAHDVGPTH